jgi:serine/threonine protein kinase
MSGQSDYPSDDTAAALSYIGSELGKYRLVELLGEGGMGWVYLAHHTTIGRRVAIKMLRPELANHPIALSRFFAEAHTVNRISHENIVEIYDLVSDDDGGEAYLVLELLEGRDLLRLMRDGERVPLQRALSIMIQAARALGAAHEAGVVHRDLKPENIYLIQRGGQTDFVKLLDFGIAKLRNAGPSTRLTQVGTSLGTPAYISPEQALGAEVDHRSDIYSFGVILYELTTGILPFASESVTDMVSRHVLETPRRPREIGERDREVPGPLDDLIMRCMAKQLDERPANMAEVERALVEVRDRLDEDSFAVPAPPFRKRPVSIRMEPEEVEVNLRRSRAWPLAVLGGLVAVGVAALVVHATADDLAEKVAPAPAVVRSGQVVAPLPPAQMDPAPTSGVSAADVPAAVEPPAVVAPPAVDKQPTTAKVVVRQPTRAHLAARKTPSRPASRRQEPAPLAADASDAIGALPGEEAVDTSSRPLDAAPPARATPAPPPAAVPPPRAVERDRGSLDAVPSIVRLTVDGPLPKSEIIGAVQRVADSFRGCYRTAAKKADRTPAVSLTISFEIDEGRAARRVRVAGDTLGLSGCVNAAMSKLRTRVAPDVGQASAVVQVKFQPTR